MSVSTLDHRSPFRMALDTPAAVVAGEVVITAANLPGATANTAAIAANAAGVAANAAALASLVIPATSGAPGDTPADGTVRFDPATGILYVKATGGWVSVTLT